MWQSARNTKNSKPHTSGPTVPERLVDSKSSDSAKDIKGGTGISAKFLNLHNLSLILRTQGCHLAVIGGNGTCNCGVERKIQSRQIRELAVLVR
jgi:hypothetical protein